MAVKKNAKKTPKKSVKKVAVKKTAVKKTAAKKTAAKKPVAKVSKKPAKAAAKKTVKKVVAKTAIKKTTAKVVAKKTAKTKTLKTALKSKPATQAPAALTVPPQAKTNLPANLQNFITPLDDRLLIRLTEAERRTAGGLYIPDTVSDVSGNLQGQVVAVGRGHFDKKGHLHPMDVQVGDRVVFTQYSGSKIKIQNEDLIILRESEVMGVVSK